MPYQSVDALQNALASSVFARTQSPKKAAGRALGTIVELLTFYLIRQWGLERFTAIERGLPEYGNPAITHNVEFTLHSGSEVAKLPVSGTATLTVNRIVRAMRDAGLGSHLSDVDGTMSHWLMRGDVVRHACLIGNSSEHFYNAYLVGENDHYSVMSLTNSPFAMFECKRVGVEEGQKKGPQTIEKAKQGAYVARTVSGLQRVPKRDGSVAALVEDADGELVTHPDYYKFLRGAIDDGDYDQLANVVVTVGVVSNHGNWFTAEALNKEMKVLAQSYDWLLFLTDDALAEFITTALLGSDSEFKATRAAFDATHNNRPRGASTTFTKVMIDAEADKELTKYFEATKPWSHWFKVIAPEAPIDGLRRDLLKLAKIRRPST